ncbi:hypothetical protein NSP_2810 [Nodularia spumigena CCY9414]|nr:hypothetical protein NSP_2810 [Nodularia spumigena CCY9414]
MNDIQRSLTLWSTAWFCSEKPKFMVLNILVTFICHFVATVIVHHNGASIFSG